MDAGVQVRPDDLEVRVGMPLGNFCNVCGSTRTRMGRCDCPEPTAIEMIGCQYCGAYFPPAGGHDCPKRVGLVTYEKREK